LRSKIAISAGKDKNQTALKDFWESFSSPFQKDNPSMANETEIERQDAQKAKVPLQLPIAPKKAKLAKHGRAFQTS